MITKRSMLNSLIKLYPKSKGVCMSWSSYIHRFRVLSTEYYPKSDTDVGHKL